MIARLSRPGPALLVVLVLALVLVPLFGTDFFLSFVMTQALILGLIAASIVFLASYGGMISLAQLLMAGIAGFMFGNAALERGARGLNLGWDPWVAALFAIAVSTVVAFLLGALASRTTGIYFLMLTLVYAVIGVTFFAQVVPVSGPGGLTRIVAPEPFDEPLGLYYAALVMSVLGYLALRAAGRTNFGLALQGVRDDPIRMASLGFNVPLHRTLAFTLAGFVAGIAGVLNVWWRGQIDPASISVGPTLILLIIAVIGGISYFEGAWLGALVYVLLETYTGDLPLIDRIGLTPDRFNTVIGLIVLLIMVLSPEGLVGILARFRGRRAGHPAGAGPADPVGLSHPVTPSTTSTAGTPAGHPGSGA
jgi:branched-chain amino acid transport system permease protein